jgi:tetratricopeptide (TPR) repeat protein
MKDLMKKILFALLVALIVFLLFYNCSSEHKEKSTEVKKDSTGVASPYTSNCAELFKKANHMDSVILNAIEANKQVGEDAIKAFMDFAYGCGNDSLAPVFLIKTAQIARSINNLPQAKISLEKCIADYPNFKDRGAAMFLLAQLYDDPKGLNDEERALEIYKEIEDSYPRTVWAANAGAAKLLLGKSDEEIIK